MQSATLIDQIDSPAQNGQEPLPGTVSEQEAPSFDALFAGDLEPVCVPFFVKDKPCEVWLLPMDQQGHQGYETEGVTYKLKRMTDDKLEQEITSVDNAARSMYLVSRTLQDWTFWRRPRLKSGGLGDWQQDRAPEADHKRIQYIKEHFKCTKEFWTWLVAQCERINGLQEEQQGN